MVQSIGSASKDQIHTELRLHIFGVPLTKVAERFLLRNGFGADGGSISYFSGTFSPIYSAWYFHYCCRSVGRSKSDCSRRMPLTAVRFAAQIRHCRFLLRDVCYKNHLRIRILNSYANNRSYKFAIVEKKVVMTDGNLLTKHRRSLPFVCGRSETIRPRKFRS